MLADGIPVIATVRSGGLTRVLWWSCWHLMPPYGGQVGGWVACPFCRGEASSEAESIRSLEGRFATLERGKDAGRCRGSPRGTLERDGDCPVDSRGFGWAALRTWAVDLGFFESFSFLRIGRRLLAFVGPVA